MTKRYRVGIDVGLYSTGLAAIEIDDSDDNPYGAIPMKLLSTMSVIHDAGIDPDKAKSADSRKSCSGVARRARKLRARKTKRLSKLDKKLDELGYSCGRAKAIVDAIEPNDPFYSWKVRATAAERYLPDEAERKTAIAVAVRSIARHRGWRNPYSSFNSLGKLCSEPSRFYLDFVERLKSGTSAEDGRKLEAADLSPIDRLTPSELLDLVGAFDSDDIRFSFRQSDEGERCIPLGKLHQSDYYHELKKIFRIQRVPEDEQSELLSEVFSVVNPATVGAAAKKIAHDDLQPNRIRASKASPTFQKYRILTTLANLSVKCNGQKQPLSDQQRKEAYEFLTSTEPKEAPSWHDFAEHLGLDRNDICGVGGQTDDGDPISAKNPPTMDTERLIAEAVAKNEELKPLLEWWRRATSDEQEMFVEIAGNAGIDRSHLDENVQKSLDKVDEFLSKQSEETLAALEKLQLPSGRVSYSVDTMRRLNELMLTEGMNLHDARKAAFNVDDDWRPAPNPLGTPVDHPAVDRTIRIVSRWLFACTEKWGAPVTVNIEHVRDGFISPKAKREYDFETNKRYKQNQRTRDEVKEKTKKMEVSRSDVRRWQALQRQNCQCAYCGTEINFITAQMDHIVPRKGAGSTNDRANLVAVCETCNKSKNNTLFSAWADKERMRETIKRVKQWNRDSTFPNDKAFREYKKDVIDRLRKTEEDEPIDSRSIESVAWMAREMAAQIEGYLREHGVSTVYGTKNDSPVHVYRGWITSEARRASGIESKLPWIGDRHGKTRLDRRHHAVDAAVIAILRPGVAQVLAERDSMHRSFEDCGTGVPDWKEYSGDAAHQDLYVNWRDNQMGSLCMLLTRAMEQGKIVVTSPLRLGLSRGRVHDDTVRKCIKIHLGARMSVNAIDKVANPAIWTALTSLPEYDENKGLPENPERTIRVHGRALNSDSEISLMCDKDDEIDGETNKITIPVRHGFAVAGHAIHHARIYRISKRNGYKYSMMRVIVSDLSKCHGDLFTYELPENSASFRACDAKLKSALRSGTAEYIGWLVVNDEMVIDPSAALFSSDGSNAVNKFMRAFPDTKRFKVTGFPGKSKIRLEALEMAREGLPELSTIADEEQRLRVMRCTYKYEDWSDSDIKDIGVVLGNEPGLKLSVDKLMNSGIDVVRRSTLGYPRWNGGTGMPQSWSTKGD